MPPKHWKKSNIEYLSDINTDRRFGRISFNVLRSLKSLGGLAKWERDWKIVKFPFRNSKPVVSLPATRGRCPPSLCSCSGTQHQPGQRQQSVGNSSSSSLYISTEALFLGFIHPRQSCCSVRPDRISSSTHPSIHLSVFTSPSAQRCAASASSPQKVRHIVFDHRTCQLFSFFFSFPFFHFCPLDFIPGGITTKFSGHRWVALPVFSREVRPLRRNPRNTEAWKRSDLWSGQEVWYISSWENPFKEARVSWGEVVSHGEKSLS